MSAEKILIVEDCVYPEGRALQRILKKAGYDVIEDIADSATAAKVMAKEYRPAVILMDIGLPEGPDAGATAAHEIQNLLNSEIIFVTGARADRALFKEIARTKNPQFLTKPFRKRQVISMVEFALTRSEKKNFVFLCYSHTERKFVDKLSEHLKPLEEIGIYAWDDSQIDPGGLWQIEIENALDAATAAVCFVSIAFLNSDFIRNEELPRILEANKTKNLEILPIFVRATERAAVESTGLLAFQFINNPEDPIIDWPDPKKERKCWVPLCERLRRL